jgi:hypothetical protein
MVGCGTVVVVGVDVVGTVVVDVEVEVEVDVLEEVVAIGTVVATEVVAALVSAVGAVAGAAPSDEHAITSCDATSSAIHPDRRVRFNPLNSA